jgi:drug/metabolite transporter (DMT)-like permease
MRRPPAPQGPQATAAQSASAEEQTGSATRGRGAQPPGGTATLRRGLFWGLLTGAFIAGYTLWDDHVVGAGEVSPVLYFWLCSALQAVLLGPVAVRRRSELRGLLTRRWGTVLTVGVLSPAAYILVLFAMQQAPVSLIAPLRETSVVIGLVLARILFGERGLASRLAGAALVVAGVALIAAG